MNSPKSNSRKSIKKEDHTGHDHSGHDHSKIRVKDSTVNVKDLEENVKAFYFDLASGLETYYPEGDYELLVTSGKRKPDDKTGKYSNTSRHNSGQAIDLRANEKVYNYLYNTKEGLGKMVTHGIGLFDETNAANLKDTGGTGAHLHLGYDSNHVAITKERFASEEITHIPMGGKGPEVIPATTSSGQSNTFVIKDEGIGYVVTDVKESPFNYMEADFLTDIEKSQNTSEKIDNSEDRQKLEELKKEEQKEKAFLKALGENTTVQRRDKPQQQSAFKEQEFEMLDLQQNLPELPSIFKTLP